VLAWSCEKCLFFNFLEGFMVRNNLWTLFSLKIEQACVAVAIAQNLYCTLQYAHMALKNAYRDRATAFFWQYNRAILLHTRKPNRPKCMNIRGPKASYPTNPAHAQLKRSPQGPNSLFILFKNINCAMCCWGRVSGEQRGGAAEILTRAGAEHGS
jgi:hypothetical protein